MNFTVVGAGYVGLSLATLISQKHKVKLFDVDKEKLDIISKKKSPIKDKEIEKFLSTKELSLEVTNDASFAYKNCDYVIVATPTNYDPDLGTFDTSSVEKVIKDSLMNQPETYVVIKSTIPLGFTNRMRSHFNTKNIAFSPEFLREGTALHDNLYPSRIIIGDTAVKAKSFAKILSQCSYIDDEKVQTFFMESSEAEAVKLFANTYLAMRVSFFNELDSFSQIHNLSTENIIKGVSSDNRIGNFYNNPSFGYGGYCLPKDTKQLLSNFNEIPSNIIKAIIDSNETRKKFIADIIINKYPKSVGIYRLTMKSNSDNFRESAVFDIVKILEEKKIQTYLYEPELESSIGEMILISDLQEFISKSDIIIANRMSPELKFVENKIYTRDLFGEN